MLDELEQDLQKSKPELQDNINAVTHDIKQKVDEYKQSADEMFTKTKDVMQQQIASGKESVTKAVQYTDKQVRENPWYAVGAAAVIGIIVGLAVSASKKSKE